MTGWLTDAFVNFIRSLFPFGEGLGDFTPDGGWVATMFGIWLPDMTPAVPGDPFASIWFVTIGIGLALSLWYAIPAIISAIATADVRALAQAVIGMAVTGFSGAAAMTVLGTLRASIIETATQLGGDATTTLLTTSVEDGNVLGVLAIVLASITYLVAGLVGGYAFVLVTVLAPIAAASLVFKSGTQQFFKWLAWFFTLLLAPVWVALAIAVVGAVGVSADAFAVKQMAAAVGIILAAAAPFTMLAVIGKLIPHGGGADNATKVGSGNTVGSAVAYSAPKIIK